MSRISQRCPEGFQIPPGTLVVSKDLPGGGKKAIKCHPEFDREHIYLVCSNEGVSTGELLTLAEVISRCQH